MTNATTEITLLLNKNIFYHFLVYALWIKHFPLSHNTQVDMDCVYYVTLSVYVAVPQGSSMSPKLYLLHNNDILSSTSNSNGHYNTL